MVYTEQNSLTDILVQAYKGDLGLALIHAKAIVYRFELAGMAVDGNTGYVHAVNTVQELQLLKAGGVASR